MSAAARFRYGQESKEVDLRRAFDKLDTKKDGKIDVEELLGFFRSRGETMSRTAVEDMVWEVDEDCDRGLTWPEFQSMYQRCDNNTSEFEPQELFNVVQFIMTDREGKGVMTLEEAMQIFYLRHGRENLDSQLEALFGTSDINSGKTLTLRDFMSSLHDHQVKQLHNSKADGKKYQAPAPGASAQRARH